MNRVFDHDDGIGTLWNRRAGHDLHRLARADRSPERLSRAHLADDAQSAWDIGGANRESIASRARKRRIIAVGPDLFGKHALIGIGRRHAFDIHRGGHFAQHASPRLFERQRHDLTVLRISIGCIASRAPLA